MILLEKQMQFMGGSSGVTDISETLEVSRKGFRKTVGRQIKYTPYFRNKHSCN